MKLIIGLGNPGREYEKTRHNIGFMAIDRIASSLNVSIDKKKMNGLYAEVMVNGEKIILLKPQMYMNLSGDVIRQYVQFYKIPVSDILVISDDLDMPIGKMKLKYKGSSGGHNGLKNIEANLGTREYKRVKVGISNDKGIDTRNYVLGSMSKDEINILEKTLDKMPNLFQDYLSLTFENLMNKYNC